MRINHMHESTREHVLTNNYVMVKVMIEGGAHATTGIWIV